MMRGKLNIIILGLLLLVSCEVEISENQASTFLKFYGNYLTDTGKDVVMTDNGGYAVAGTSTIPGSGTAMALYLTDRFGNLLERFPKFYRDGNNSGVNDILKLSDGYLLTGYVLLPAGGGEYQEDIYIVRTNLQGEVIWSRTYGGTENENAYHAIEGNDGGFIIAGYRETNQEKDYWIFAVNDQGDFIRAVPSQPIPDTDDDVANYLISVPDQGYLCVCTYDEDTYNGTNVFVLAINSDLNSPYNLSLGTDFNDYGRCIIKEEGESYLVLGNSDNTSTGRSEISVYRVEMNGLRFENSSLVATIQSGFEDLTGERLVLTPEGRLAIIGSSYSNEDYNMLLQFIDSDAVSGRIYFGETGSQTGSAIGYTEEGKFIIVGTNAYEGNSMISLVKTTGDGEL